MARLLGLLVQAAVTVAGAGPSAPAGRSLLQAWASGGTSDTPVTRVVNLLKEMSQTLEKEMEEDENLYKQLACWCNDGKYEKRESVKASTQKIEQLEASIESLTAGSSQLATLLKELEVELAADKQALAEATALNEKSLQEFHAIEVDSIQALENLKGAITVLSKHQGAPPESTVAGGAVFKSEKDQWSFQQVDFKGFPWSARDDGVESLDKFMRANGFSVEDDTARAVAPHKFLQQPASSPATPASAWSAADAAVVKRALRSAAAFMQARHSSGYYPAYQARSGEIFGILKQMEEEMSADLKGAQQREQARAAAFAELRKAKTSEIEEAEKMSERKEDEKAKTDNELAEAKEDLAEEQKVLGADQEFLRNLEVMCAEGESNFQERKKARQAEMQAVADTIQILHGDEARDAMSSTFKGFFQLALGRHNDRRQEASKTLRLAAHRLHSPQLSVLATAVELDAFTKVKKAIDDMIAILKQQQEDEVKKSDWCKAELHTNELNTAKTEDHKADLEAKIAELATNIQTLETEITDATAQIASLQLELQRATEDRQKENLDFQKTVADQTITVEVLKKALDRLAKFYGLVQVQQAGAARQTPPVPQVEYKKSAGASGVMQMLNKLVQDAEALRADARKTEGEAQAAYEQTIADTNASVEALQKAVLTKTEAKAHADKVKRTAEQDLFATVDELEGLSKYNIDLHKECDYVLKNFQVRQNGRAEEIEALQQAKQILSGASLS